MYRCKKAGSIANCETCGSPFIVQMPNHRFCKPSCQKSTAKKIFSYLAIGKGGAITELLIAVDLLRRGFDVFRSVNPHSKFDLVIFGKGKFLKIEAKTAHRNPSTKTLTFSGHPHSDHDVLALHVVETGEILYLDPKSPGKKELPEFGP